MAIADQKSPSDNNNNKVWGFFKLPFRGSNSNTTPSSSSSTHLHNHNNPQIEGSNAHASNSVSSVARSLLPTRRRLKLDPAAKLYFPYEPGKQVRSAIKIKNTSKSYVAFKFQTTAPKSCFMRPPGAILAPGESLIATVFKFVEPPENNEKPVEQKSKVKFKIMSLKVKGAMDYVPELALEKLKRQLADADAAVEARKKPPEDAGPRIIGEGLVIDEWKERRERYLARQQVEGVDSV
ncbi:vesicle-associated protein 4-2 isoform X2 [Manihot esculenta]|uniref:Uncharacterized protein n=1 Tax=Manihot esculenta TaxID=3983 RepID=A0ACB7G714_MANES|nr:vesicle-associated protein 4-2 isoform X2 [Manihot esculenta]KAG8635328.1 hypothetical protein MANES_16G020000v8 [Manihot esculenta]